MFMIKFYLYHKHSKLKDIIYMEEIEIKEEVETLEKKSDDEYQLLVINDDINTFDHVINNLIDICDIDNEHAIKCTILIHNLGKCVIVEGDKDKLSIMEEGLNMVGIDATVRKKNKE